MTGNAKRTIEPFYRDLGLKIREKRERRGLTQGTLGETLRPSATRASIANIESGNQRVLAHTLIQIAETLKVDLNELVPIEPKDNIRLTTSAVAKELREKVDISNDSLRRITQKLSKKHTTQHAHPKTRRTKET